MADSIVSNSTDASLIKRKIIPNEPVKMNSNLQSEGDINITPARKRWAEKNIDAQTKRLLDEDASCFLHQTLSTPCLNVIESCSGSRITLSTGQSLLDFHGNYIHNLGFGHPEIIEAITEILPKLSFSTRRYTNRYAIDLAKKLTSYTPSLTRVLFAPGGAEAISMAIKVARAATGRHKTISMWDSFHGATLDAISIGGEAVFRKDIGPLMPGTHHAPPPNPSECPFHCGNQCNLNCAGYIEYILEKEGDVSAVIAETIRCAPFIPPKEYWQSVRAACDRHGAVLILDEIPHALGRTGKMFTFQHYGIEPDMVVIGKGLGGGIMPFAALIAKEEFNEKIKNQSLGHFTHEKNPVACVAALKMLEIIERDNLLEHVHEMHRYSMKIMTEMKENHPFIHDTRALGLIMGIELRHPENGAKAADLAEAVMYRSLELGLSFKCSMGNILNLTPPINVSKNELEEAFTIINQALAELS